MNVMYQINSIWYIQDKISFKSEWRRQIAMFFRMIDGMAL